MVVQMKERVVIRHELAEALKEEVSPNCSCDWSDFHGHLFTHWSNITCQMPWG